MTEFVLIHAPMIGPETMAPTAAALRLKGHGAQVPDVLAQAGGFLKLSAWPDAVAALVDGDGPFVLVAHSAATPVAAALSRLGNVSGLVFLDGFIPPASGPTPPSESGLLELIRTLPSDEDGRLPPWPQWWKTEVNNETLGMTALAAKPDLHRQVIAGMPTLTLDWFDDAIELREWAKTPSGFIRTSSYHDFSATAAEGRGWPLIRLDGTHLHPALAPDETADAILSISQTF